MKNAVWLGRALASTSQQSGLGLTFVVQVAVDSVHAGGAIVGFEHEGTGVPEPVAIAPNPSPSQSGYHCGMDWQVLPTQHPFGHDVALQTHRLAEQIVPEAHALPQAPQLLLSLVILTSQPSAGLLLQSANPVVHDAMAQLELLHTGVALTKAHFVPQRPQLLTSLVVLISQPSVA